ncbi:hypothetical protein ACOMHN_028814 [Nucella lapillus]
MAVFCGGVQKYKWCNQSMCARRAVFSGGVQKYKWCNQSMCGRMAVFCGGVQKYKWCNQSMCGRRAVFSGGVQKYKCNQSMCGRRAVFSGGVQKYKCNQSMCGRRAVFSGGVLCVQKYRWCNQSVWQEGGVQWRCAVCAEVQKYLMSGSSSLQRELGATQRERLIQEFFSPAGVSVPEVEGALYLKSDGKKAWKKYFFVLRASGLYYNPKGKVSKVSEGTGASLSSLWMMSARCQAADAGHYAPWTGCKMHYAPWTGCIMPHGLAARCIMPIDWLQDALCPMDWLHYAPWTGCKMHYAH